MRTPARRQRGGLVCLCLALACLAWYAAPALAATRTVTTTTDRDNGSYTPGNVSLREAVKYANYGDTVEFIINGTFTLTMGEIVIDKNLTISGNNPTVTDSVTQISAGGASRVFKITSGTVTIKNLVILQGHTHQDPGGGGIFNDGVLTLEKVRIGSCSTDAQNGGGVYSRKDINIIGCFFYSNHAAGDKLGGALHVYKLGGTTPTAIITDTYFGPNNVSDGGGGAVAGTSADIHLTRCIFDSNQSQGGGHAGGAVCLISGSCTVTDCTFKDNAADVYGGAIDASTPAPLTITGSTFSGNSAGAKGGALYQVGGDLVVTNCTFTENTADKDGGALWVSPGSGTPGRISFTTITGNITDADCGDVGGTCNDGAGGGLYLDGGNLYLRGVILAGNTDNSTSGAEYSQCYCATATAISAGYNMVGTYLGCAAAFPSGSPNVNHDYVVSPMNPLLGALADNGGPTKTCRPLSYSVAVNHGPPDGTDSGGDPVTTDQRGKGRVRGGVSDIGAYELEIGSGAPLGMLLE